MAQEARSGDTVQVNYTGKFDNGDTFDSSEGRDPLEFTIGEGDVIPGFENAVIGMQPGDKKTVNIPAEEAYGARREEMIVQVDKEDLPEGFEPSVGDMMEVTQGEFSMPVTIVDVADGKVTIDANHPLAGRDLVFDIELAGIKGALITEV